MGRWAPLARWQLYILAIMFVVLNGNLSVLFLSAERSQELCEPCGAGSGWQRGAL
jgi:hypothetical protein